MEKVSRMFFDPLLKEEDQIRSLLLNLPVGSAHPFHDQLLIRYAVDSVTSVDISMHTESYLSHAINLRDPSEGLVDRIKLFGAEPLDEMADRYSIQQAPASTFKIPIINDKIHIFAVSLRQPSNVYNLCVADNSQSTSCSIDNAQNTFPGIIHSSNCMSPERHALLQYIMLNEKLDETARVVFVSGHSSNHQALHTPEPHDHTLLVVDHSKETLYMIPVPLEAAIIGEEASLCCILVIRKVASDNTLVCSILPTPTVDTTYCTGRSVATDAFQIAINRTITHITQPVADCLLEHHRDLRETNERLDVADPQQSDPPNKRVLIIATWSSILEDLDTESAQVIRFGEGIHWMRGPMLLPAQSSSIVLPCIVGGMMDGPMLLALGRPPNRVPFSSRLMLHQYYNQARSVVVVVDEQMTDNARNTATPWRLNGLFILQLPLSEPGQKDIMLLLEEANINAITAVAGPHSLILAKLGTKYFYYRGVANPRFLDTCTLEFAQDVTELVSNAGGLVKLAELTHFGNYPRIVDLNDSPIIYFPSKPCEDLTLDVLEMKFRDASLTEIRAMKNDMLAAVPQLQGLLSQVKLQKLSRKLISIVSAKVNDELQPLRHGYAHFVLHMYVETDECSHKRKNTLRAEFHDAWVSAHNSVQWLSMALSNIISNQTTSSRTHDLEELARQKDIQRNVDIADELNFDKLSAMLEDGAAEMGVLVINFDRKEYLKYVQRSLRFSGDSVATAAVCSTPCFLDKRTLNLDGLDASSVLSYSQLQHTSHHPLLALKNLTSEREEGPTCILAWVCWDRFVQMRDPYKVRWTEVCNEPSIAVLQIVMRRTLCQVTSSPDFPSLEPGNEDTGQLMGALLMMAMTELAKARNTIPQIFGQDKQPNDTTILLMRGLFGHFLAIAGSGKQSLSHVWQLFGDDSDYELPGLRAASWRWYETATRLLPYSGWPRERYISNIVGLLDKLIFQSIMVEKADRRKERRTKSLKTYCRSRKDQLHHSQIIVTVLNRLIIEQNKTDGQKSAWRLLEVLPEHVEDETHSYTKLHRYIQHLAGGGEQRSQDNLVAANVFTKRSAVFKKKKIVLAKLLCSKELDKQKIVAACREINLVRDTIAREWNLDASVVHMQNDKAVQAILRKAQKEIEANTDSVHDAASNDGMSSQAWEDLKQRILGDAELKRTPWGIGDKQQFGEIKQLDDALVSRIMGEDTGMDNDVDASSNIEWMDAKELARRPKQRDNFSELEKPVDLEFSKDMMTVKTPEKVCWLLGITLGAMEAFVAMLVPNRSEEAMQGLPARFKQLVTEILQHACRDAEKVKPTMKLLGQVHCGGIM